MKTPIDEIDAKVTVTVAHSHAADTQWPDLGCRCPERIGRGFRDANRNRKVNVLGRAWNAPRLKRKPAD